MRAECNEGGRLELDTPAREGKQKSLTAYLFGTAWQLLRFAKQYQRVKRVNGEEVPGASYDMDMAKEDMANRKNFNP